MMEETKFISLDLGSNLARFEVRVAAENPVKQLTAGITQHEKDGINLADMDAGCFSYWQPHGDSELGMGIVVPSAYLDGYDEYLTDERDQSHLLVHMKPVNGKVVYYAGFGWKKSGRFEDENAWFDYLKGYAQKLSSPITYQIK
jgi:hypothetical protein